MGIIDSGFMVAAPKDGNRFYYSQIEDKRQLMGFYRSDKQTEKLPSSIQAILRTKGIVFFVLKNKTYANNLTQFTDVGNSRLGESIAKLNMTSCIDDHIGVIHTKSIDAIGSGIFIAITSEPAIRKLSSQGWEPTNLAENNGISSIMNDLKSLDASSGVQGFYSQDTGYIFWAKIKTITNNYNDYIIDCGGDSTDFPVLTDIGGIPNSYETIINNGGM